jgi:serine/threonine protein kinase
LPDGSEIAVKLLLTKTQQETKEFSNEVALVTSMSHKNLVKLKGCCFGNHDQRILVYEFVENNNLAEVIFGNIFYPTIGKSNPIENKCENNNIVLLFNVIL